MRLSLTTGVAIVLCVVAPLAIGQSDDTETEHADLFRGCRDAAVLPASLKRTYTEFALAAPEGEVEQFCLPHAVQISTELRPEAPSHRDINLPFLKTQFSAEVFSARKDSKDCYLIRTATTALHFVETRSGKWRIYAYVDKPIA